MCEKCNNTGWILYQTFQDKIKEEYSVFKALLYVECECLKEKKAKNAS